MLVLFLSVKYERVIIMKKNIGLMAFGIMYRCLVFVVLIYALKRIGEESYERMYKMVDDWLEEDNAVEDYEELVGLIDKLSIKEGDDLSKKIFNLTSVKVGENRLFDEFNKSLMEADSKVEVESLVMDYLKDYVSFIDGEVKKEDVRISDEGMVSFGDEPVVLDYDFMEVLAGVMENIDASSTKEELIKAAVITEFYEREEDNNKQLSIKPLNRPDYLF